MPSDAHATLLRGTGSVRAFSPEAWNPARSPARRASAEEGVRLAYGAAGLAQPRIVWCRSPVELAEAWAVAGGESGANLKDVLFHHPYGEGQRRIDRAAADVRQGHRRLRCEASHVAATVVAEVVTDAVGRKTPRLLSWLRRTLGRSHTARRRPVFAENGCGPAELSGASLVAYIEESLDGGTADTLVALRLISENAGWLVPHERMCWLSERPEVVRTDSEGRLHCASGPALRYRDGWCRFAWKGVVVPAWAIERPQVITLDWIDAQIDPPVRHAMIDILTAERFIAAGGADVIATDSRAVLWGRTWTHRGVMIDRWRAVESAGVAGSKRTIQPVPGDMETPQEALDWLVATMGPATAAGAGR